MTRILRLSDVVESQEGISIVSRSILGLGLRSAMDEIVSFHTKNMILSPSDITNVQIVDSVGENSEIMNMAFHPCLATGEFLPGSIHEYNYNLYGEGNFTKCLNLIR